MTASALAQPVEALTESTLRPGEVLQGRYEARRLLGAGGMGAVWIARDLTLGRDVALKLLHAHVSSAPGAAERFEREAKVLARIDHEGAVRVYDFGRAGDQLFLVMELVDGVSLDEALTNGPFEPARVIRLGLDILEVLGAAHALGIVHRDLKPSNLLLYARSGFERVKLLDFGIALDPASEPDARLTRQGAVLGTPAYMSPEQCRGLELDGRSDLYALGCVLYELLTGEPPFGTGASADLMSYHLFRPVRAPGRAYPELGISEALDRIIVRALQKRPEDRWGDASAMREALWPLAGEALPAMPRLELSVEKAAAALTPRVNRAPTLNQRLQAPADATEEGSLALLSAEPVGLLAAAGAPALAEVEAALSLRGSAPVLLDPTHLPSGLGAVVVVGVDGRDALALARPLAARPEAPPIVLCGADDDLDLMTSAIEVGVFDYAPLPLDTSELSRKVDRAVRRARSSRV